MHLITPFQHFFQHSLCPVKLCLNRFGIFIGSLGNFIYRKFLTEMRVSHFFVGTF